MDKGGTEEGRGRGLVQVGPGVQPECLCHNVYEDCRGVWMRSLSVSVWLPRPRPCLREGEGKVERIVSVRSSRQTAAESGEG